jgi:NAD(P)H-hydrate epimerase
MRNQQLREKNAIFTGPRELKLVTKARNEYASKRDFGSLLIVGGSDVYSGAPALAGMAALRTGVGLSVVAAPSSVVSVIRSYSPNLIVHPLPTDVVTPTNLSIISELLTKANALVLGPGLGMHDETKSAIPLIVAKAHEHQRPVLIDADGIRALRDSKNLLKGTVITPHAGEFKAISGVDPPPKWRDRLETCKLFAQEHSCFLLLKGHDTVVTDGTRLKVNRTGNPGMATGGMGDVLSGIIGAYLAQGTDPFLAAVAGAYVHGLAGDFVHKRKGFHMVASDIIETLPEILKPYDHEQ